MGMVFYIMLMVVSMLVNQKIVNGVEKVFGIIQMMISMMENGRTTKRMAKEITLLMVTNMMASLKMEKGMVKAFVF